MKNLNEIFIADVYNSTPASKYTDTVNFDVTEQLQKEYYACFHNYLIGALGVSFELEGDTINKQALLATLQKAVKFAKEKEQQAKFKMAQ